MRGALTLRRQPAIPRETFCGIEVGEKQKSKPGLLLRYRSDAVVQGPKSPAAQQSHEFARHHEYGVGRVRSRRQPAIRADLETWRVRLREAQEMPVLVFEIDGCAGGRCHRLADLDHGPTVHPAAEAFRVLKP